MLLIVLYCLILNPGRTNFFIKTTTRDFLNIIAVCNIKMTAGSIRSFLANAPVGVNWFYIESNLKKLEKARPCFCFITFNHECLDCTLKFRVSLNKAQFIRSFQKRIVLMNLYQTCEIGKKLFLSFAIKNTYNRLN